MYGVLCLIEESFVLSIKELSTYFFTNLLRINKVILHPLDAIRGYVYIFLKQHMSKAPTNQQNLNKKINIQCLGILSKVSGCLFKQLYLTD